MLPCSTCERQQEENRKNRITMLPLFVVGYYNNIIATPLLAVHCACCPLIDNPWDFRFKPQYLITSHF
ncbi:hypothetical protein BJX99DRAFT_224785 [Aspergillus californicus]